MNKVKFHGAAHEVTGSMHLLELNGSLIALDCGLFQGRRAEAAEKNRTFPCDPRDIDAVILSHAHIDHSGKLPKLVKDGFTGEIHCTSATKDLAAVLLQDSAHIQFEDARYMNKKLARKGQPLIQPLYEPEDVPPTLRHITGHPYDRYFYVAKGVRAKFVEAGHILGSAGVHLEVTGNDGKTCTIGFTGDLGRWSVPILRDPKPLPPSDYLISESTYGGRHSEQPQDMKGQLLQVIQDTVARNGKIMIPAFSVGRTQTLLYYLNELFASGELASLPVFVDSPLAIDATEVFRMHPECHDRDARTFHMQVGHLLRGPNMKFTRSVEESKAIMRRRRPAVIIAASGMCEAGRILHHLKNGSKHKKNTILIVGYQAQHTLGRRIVEGASHIKVYGQKYPLNAQVVVMNGFSSHADCDELMRYLELHKDTCKKLFLVHGDPVQSMVLQGNLINRGFADVEYPESGTEFILD